MDRAKRQWYGSDRQLRIIVVSQGRIDHQRVAGTTLEATHAAAIAARLFATRTDLIAGHDRPPVV
jgi:hypothetical protein